jgi:hypothetical protein
MYRVFLIFNFTFLTAEAHQVPSTAGVSHVPAEEEEVKLKDNSTKGLAGCPYNNHARCGMVIIERT